MRVWGQMEDLCRQGLVRGIGTSNMTVAKMELLLRDCKINPVVTGIAARLGVHPAVVCLMGGVKRGEVILKTKSCTICGSDIRCIYREHTGKGPEGYQKEMIAGHEPCGQIVKCGPGMRRFKEGDRVIVYHISG